MVSPIRRARTTAGGKLSNEMQKSDGEILSIATPAPVAINPARSALIASLTTSFCRLEQSAVRRDCRSPDRTRSKKATSCRSSSEVNVSARRRAATRSPATAMSRPRTATMIDCALKRPKRAVAAAAGVQLSPPPARQESITAPMTFGNTTEMDEDPTSSTSPPAKR